MSEKSTGSGPSRLSFDSFFTEVEKSTGYWVSKAKIDFTEEMLGRMSEMKISKSELARRLSVSLPQVTRLCGGRNNFTLATMVAIARALDCEFCMHLQRPGRTSEWLEFIVENPERIKVGEWSNQTYVDVAEAEGRLSCLVSP